MWENREPGENPVGSKGVLYEAHLLAIGAGCELAISPDRELDLNKSAGPATCVLAAAEPDSIETLRNAVSLPVFSVGTLR